MERKQLRNEMQELMSECDFVQLGHVKDDKSRIVFSTLPELTDNGLLSGFLVQYGKISKKDKAEIRKMGYVNGKRKGLITVRFADSAWQNADTRRVYLDEYPNSK